MSPQGEGRSPLKQKRKPRRGLQDNKKDRSPDLSFVICVRYACIKKKTSARLDLTKHKDGRDNVDIWRLIRNPLVNLIISIYIVTPKVK